MPKINRWSGDEQGLGLASVAHVSSAESAAMVLYDSIVRASTYHGDTPDLIEPDEANPSDWGVRWRTGPDQWALAYVIGEGVTAPEFTCFADDDETVIFSDNN